MEGRGVCLDVLIIAAHCGVVYIDRLLLFLSMAAYKNLISQVASALLKDNIHMARNFKAIVCKH